MKEKQNKQKPKEKEIKSKHNPIPLTEKEYIEWQKSFTDLTNIFDKKKR